VSPLTVYSSGDEATTLKAQVAELYKTQNTHLQTIKSLETGLTALQETEKLLKQEYFPPSNYTSLCLALSNPRLSDIRARRKDLELKAALHGETLREKNQQIQVPYSLPREVTVDPTR